MKLNKISDIKKGDIIKVEICQKQLYGTWYSPIYEHYDCVNTFRGKVKLVSIRLKKHTIITNKIHNEQIKLISIINR